MKSISTEITECGAPANLFRTLARRWLSHAGHLPDPYRPERHYMRGSGPKSCEKRDSPENNL